MGRRKIEIKAIKDDRNRSVTFLKRKGGLFKKAHELSVLCSVDVAVFIFGNNKKLYQYSSSDMNQLIQRYQYHGGPNEHKGPADFNGGNDDDEDDEGDGTPPRGQDGPEPQQMMPPHYAAHPQFPHLRHQTSSASPPMPNGAFQGHPAHHPPLPHAQPHGESRPSSRNDGGRAGPVPTGQGPPPHNGIAYMPTPPIYNPPPGQANMIPPNAAGYVYPPSQQPYVDDRRPSAPPAYTTQPPQQSIPVVTHPEPSPPQPAPQHLPPHQPIPQISVQPHQPERHPQDPQPPAPMEPSTEVRERPQRPLLNTDSAIKKLPAGRKGHSIFTPVEKTGSILFQHVASFSEPQPKSSPEAPRMTSVPPRSASGSATHSASPPAMQKPAVPIGPEPPRNGAIPGAPEAEMAPLSRTNSLKIGGTGTRSRGPRLTVQIPEGDSEQGSANASSSPRNLSDSATQPPRQNPHSAILPPPSPSASAILSAGATGPPNPFARPPPQQTVNGETPVSALPSRFLNSEFLPSPSSFYHDWSFRGSDSNTLPSPLNFATPVVGSGPSFLRDDPAGSGHGGSAAPATTASSSSATGAATTATAPPEGAKRKSSSFGPDQAEGLMHPSEAKRVKVE